MSVDGSGSEGAPVKPSGIPQAERQSIGNRWAAMDNPSGKTPEQEKQVDQKAAQNTEAWRKKHVGTPQEQLEVLQEEQETEERQRQQAVTEKINTITQQEDPQKVITELGTVMDNDNTLLAKAAVEKVVKMVNQPDISDQLRTSAIQVLGKYAGLGMNFDQERYHDIIRPNQKTARDAIATIAGSSEDPAVIKLAVQELGKGLSLPEGSERPHREILDHVTKLALKGENQGVRDTAIVALQRYSELKPHPGHNDFHTGYLGSRAFEPVQGRARSAVNTMRTTQGTGAK